MQTPAPAAEAPAAQATPAPDSGIGAPTTPRPDLKLPELRDLGVAVPRPVRVATAMLGMGRQRLALVVGISTVGARQVIDTAGRDAHAVAAALREGGFVVMLREDLGSADLRAALSEFHDRLQPGGLGFAYLTGLGAQVDGQNLLLPRDSNLDTARPLTERQAQWRKTGVPLSDVVDALMGPPDSPRLLVVDAAYQNPALAGLPAAGLAAQKLPPGMMALYGHPLGKTQNVPAVGALPNPPPTDARELAASPFARALVAQLLAPRKRAPEVLRATHRSLYDGSLGQNDLWMAGDTDNEELAEASLLDVLPRTPEELAREAASQVARALTRHSASAAASTAGVTASASSAAGTAGMSSLTATAASGAAAGEQSVAEVLERVPKSQPSLNPDELSNANMKPSSARNAVADTPSAPSAPSMASTPSNASAPKLPDVPRPPSSLLSQAASAASAASAGSAGSAVNIAAGVAGTLVSAAGTVATVAVLAKAAEAAATVSLATTALGVVGSAAGQAAGLAVRSLTGSAAEPPGAALQQIAASRAAPLALAQVAAVPVISAPAVAAAAPGSIAPVNLPVNLPVNVPVNVPVNAPFNVPAHALVSALTRASASTGDLPVASFSPAAPITAAPPLATSPTIGNSTLSPAKALKPGIEAPDNRTVRNAGGGERPFYAPRTNSYGYAEGDTYTYQVTDAWKDEVINRYTTAIEEVLPDGQLLANGQQLVMDAQGRLKKQANADGTVSNFEPSQDLWWSNPKRGESRDLRFTETIQRAGGRSTEVQWKGSTSVGKPQKIDTPAGEFEVLPMESSGWAYEVAAEGLRSTKWSRTVWYSPMLGHPVAIDIQDADGLGKLLKRERVELLHAQASRAASP